MLVKIKDNLINVDIANTKEEKSKGLMFRESIPDDYGMLFVYGENETPSIWMKNTFVDLDILFIADDMSIMKIAKGDPLDESPIKCEGAKYVLELPGGYCNYNNIVVGDYINKNIDNKKLGETISNKLESIGCFDEALYLDELFG